MMTPYGFVNDMPGICELLVPSGTLRERFKHRSTSTLELAWRRYNQGYLQSRGCRVPDILIGLTHCKTESGKYVISGFDQSSFDK